MRRAMVGLIVIVGLALVSNVASAKEKKHTEHPDGTISLSTGSVAAGIGFSWGSGTLTYHGKKYPFSIDGLSVGAVGISRATASGTVWHLIMPAVTLGWYFAASHMRMTRSSMLEVLGSEYVKLARLKGLPEALVIGKHAFKNALIPVITLAGINLVVMINVATVVEMIFAWPGIGRLLYEGVSFRDFPVVQAVVVLCGTMIIGVNLLVDIVYALIDPRIRLES